MLADQLDYVVGVDPHRDSHSLAVVHIVSGAVVFESTIVANGEAGLTRFLTGRGERVLEVSRLRRERRSGGKTDALDAVRAPEASSPSGGRRRRAQAEHG